ncbi:MAG: aminotransferase class III-fold pyridoxal phosphate-dependent enzyme, partial [Acidobacteriota bacterium]
QRVRRVPLSAPERPFISNLTGRWITDREATDPGYWARHLRGTVRFAAGVETLLDDSVSVLLEVGPGRALSSLSRQHTAYGEHHDAVSSMRAPKDQNTDDGAAALAALGHLWRSGVAIDWQGFYADENRRRVTLPTTPFERQTYWIDRRPMVEVKAETPAIPAPEVAQESSASANSSRETPPGVVSRRDRLGTALSDLYLNITGNELASTATESSFLELGMDSLSLMQLSQGVKERFGVDIAFRRLLEEVESPGDLLSFLEEHCSLPDFEDAPEQELEAPLTAALGSTEDAALVQAVAHGELLSEAEPALPTGMALDRAVGEHIERLSRQLDWLRQSWLAERQGGGTTRSAVPAPAASTVVESPPPGPRDTKASRSASFGPWRPLNKRRDDGLNDRQRRYLETFTTRYGERTAHSKALTQEHRDVLADVRVPLGFRRLWKELIYPITAERSAGSRLWDVDGNEYVDLVMGFGVNLLGHSPPFVTEALAQQLGEGIQIGPQTELAGRAARLLSELTGCERVCFCNTGSEAVMAALRLARTVSGRNKIAFFSGSYHGISDSVLARVRGSGEKRSSVPIAPGIPQRMVDDSLILDYGHPESLEILERRARELGAVLVEPIQAAQPTVQPKEFLQQLRALTRRLEIPLIFDEMITGFRVHRGGAQAWFDVQADLVTYGKVVGGGLPIGVVAGSATLMDAVDGGFWRFGDDSYPTANQTVFAGTFSKHPLALAAAVAVLEHLKDQGSELQQRLNERAAQLAETLDAWFKREGLPIHMDRFASLFRFNFAPELEFADLFPVHMIERGIFMGGRSCFLSTAHTDEDLQRILAAVESSISAMRSGDLMPHGPGGQKPLTLDAVSASVASSPEVSVSDTLAIPLTEEQQALWMAAQMGQGASQAYNEVIALRLKGRLDTLALERALETLAERHQALRTVFDPSGEQQLIGSRGAFGHERVELRHLSPESVGAETQGLLRRLSLAPFDLVQGPLARCVTLRTAANEHLLVLVFHHLIIDGWSLDVVLDELCQLYAVYHTGAAAELPPAARFSDYVLDQQAPEQQKQAEAYWLERFQAPLPVFEPPTDLPRPAFETFTGERAQRVLTEPLVTALRDFSRRLGITFQMSLLGSFQLLLHRLTGGDDLVVGVPAAGQTDLPGETLVGYCIQLMPLRSQVVMGQSIRDYFLIERRNLLDAYQHRSYPLARLIRELDIERDPSRPPLVGVIFNLDRAGSPPGFAGLVVEPVEMPTPGAKFELNLRCCWCSKCRNRCAWRRRS